MNGSENCLEASERPWERVFGVVCKGHPRDFQMWLESAKTHEIRIVQTRSTRDSKLIIREVPH